MMDLNSSSVVYYGSARWDFSYEMCPSSGDGKAITFQFYGMTLLFVAIWPPISVRNVLICLCLLQLLFTI